MRELFTGELYTGKTKAWLAVGAAILLLQVTVSLTVHDRLALAVFSNGVQCIALIACAVGLLLKARAAENQIRLFWFFMVAGILCWLGYQFLWTYFEVVLRRATPNPFDGDVLLFIHIVPMMAALCLRAHREQDRRILQVGRLDFVLLLLFWVYVYLLFVIPWQYIFPYEQMYGDAFNALYITEKVVFLGGLFLSWRWATGHWRTLHKMWFAAMVVYGASAYLANRAIDNHTYYTGSLYDLPLVISMVAFAVIAHLPWRLESSAASSGERRHQGVWTARLAMGAMLSMPILALWAMSIETPDTVRRYRLDLTLGMMVLMGGFVFLKQHLLDRELLRSLRATEESYENLRRVQGQLVQTEKLASLGQLVGGAAHELNNPLTAVLGYAELLSATQPLSNEQKSLTDKILLQVNRTKALVSSLLNFAQQSPGEHTRVDLNGLVRTAAKQLQPHLRTKKIELRSELTALPLIEGDKNQLLQVCLQIISNAHQALEEVGGGILWITTGQHEGFATIEFADNGPGAPDPARVFDPFYTTKGVGKGAGLGLSACYGIIQQHHGRIFCRNRTEGGALFRVELPLIAGAPSLPPAPAAVEEVSTPTAPRVVS